MKFLHTMIRVGDLDASLEFFSRRAWTTGGAPHSEREGALYARLSRRARGRQRGQGKRTRRRSNSPITGTNSEYAGGRNFGHLAFAVENIYDVCARLQAAGVTINRPPRDGHMAFVQTPDMISIELLQKGAPLPPTEPWASAPNVGAW